MTEPTDEQKRQELAEAGSLEDLLLKTAARLQADHAARAAMETKRYRITRIATRVFDVEARDRQEAVSIVDELVFEDEDEQYSMDIYDDQTINLVSDDEDYWEPLNS